MKLSNLARTILISGLAIIFLLSPIQIFADQLQDQINALDAQINQRQETLNQLRDKQDTLEDKLALLDAEIDYARVSIADTKAKLSQTETEIQTINEDLQDQKVLLSQNFRLLYQENQVKTLELLVSSSSLSDFVNRQEYISKIGEKIDASIADIKSLKDQLEQEYKNQQQLAAAQQAQADNLAAQIAEQQRILSVTNGEEAKYQDLIAQDQEKRVELEAQQAAAIAAASQQITYTGGDGSYPWSGVSFPSFQSDPWGFYLRQCTSYAAWKRATIGKAIPAWGTMGPADAKNWVGWAGSFGYSVDQNPQYGDVAVYQGGVYGHVGIVEEVLDGGNSVRISEYNAQFDGQFSYSIWPTSSLMFIH